ARRGAGACGGSTERLDALLGDGPDPLGRIGMIGLGAAEGGRCWIQASWRPEQRAQPT
ncbi:MAG: hypothetical protein H7X93_12385, partial [Sphingomonadaceae bacterium]|nr:hypothetical protein [Sphingomonadaceae bacterium]